MSENDVRYDAQDYARAGRIAADLAKGGYDLSLSERTALRQASELLLAWGRMMPRTQPEAGRPGTRDKA